MTLRSFHTASAITGHSTLTPSMTSEYSDLPFRSAEVEAKTERLQDKIRSSGDKTIHLATQGASRGLIVSLRLTCWTAPISNPGLASTPVAGPPSACEPITAATATKAAARTCVGSR